MESPLVRELRFAADQLRRGGQVSPHLLSEAADEIVGLRARLGQANARLVRLESQAEALLDVVEELGGKFENNNEKAD